MPRYTQARLAYALEVFRDSLPYRTKSGFQTDNLERHLKKYDLRTATSKALAPRSSLWVDKDDSGDYDPSSSKNRQPGSPIPKARHNKRKGKDVGDDRENERSIKNKRRMLKSGRRSGDSCKVVLKPTMAAGKRKLQELADAGGLPLQADAFGDVEDGQPSLWSLGGGSFSQTSRSFLSSAARRRSIFGPEAGGDGDDKEGLPRCGGGGIRRTETLVVGKARESHQASPRCTPWRQGQTTCMQKPSDVGACCTQGSKEGTEGCFSSPNVQKENAISPLATQPDSPVIIASRQVACLDTKWITTSFAYPINFQFSAAQDPTRKCDFCRDYRYGILGCGAPKKVEVILEGGQIVEEMGGFRTEGREATNMCIMCALDRFQICRCTTHEIVPIAGLCPADFDYRAAFDSFLTLGTPASNHWCTICVSPAFFVCSALQQCNKFGRPLAPGARMENGCGLLLCPACAGAVRQFGMDRVKLEEDIRSRGSWKIRADMQFLFYESDLHKAYHTS